jgi:hypothetical protein
MSAMSELHAEQQEHEVIVAARTMELLMAIEKAISDLQVVSKHPVIGDVVRELRAAIREVRAN